MPEPGQGDRPTTCDTPSGGLPAVMTDPPAPITPFYRGRPARPLLMLSCTPPLPVIPARGVTPGLERWSGGVSHQNNKPPKGGMSWSVSDGPAGYLIRCDIPPARVSRFWAGDSSNRSRHIFHMKRWQPQSSDEKIPLGGSVMITMIPPQGGMA